MNVQIKKMSKTNELNYRTLTIERKFIAPIQIVWDAWTKSEQIGLWWGPQGMQTKVIQHDFKLGGSWKYVMTMPNGIEFITEGVFRNS